MEGKKGDEQVIDTEINAKDEEEIQVGQLCSR